MTIYTSEERQQVLDTLLDALRGDGRIAGVLVVGSGAVGFKDNYSDIDLSVVVSSEADVEPVFRDWDGKIQAQFSVVTRFETHYGPNSFLYGFLLDNFLELDIGFISLNNLVTRRPYWQIAFDRSGQIQSIMEASLVNKPTATKPDKRYQQALESVWHYIMHSAICLRREQNWRAVYYLDMVRQQTIELAGLRLGLETKNYRQVDQFPADLLLSLQQSFPSDFSPGKIMYALKIATQCFFDETAVWEEQPRGTLIDLLQGKIRLFLELIDEELNALHKL